MLNNTLKRKLSISLTGISVAVMSLAYGAGIANATSTNDHLISIPVTEVVRNVGVGSTTELASEDVDEEYVGMDCMVKAIALNQGSVHPGNNLVVASGGDSVTLEDVEREAGVNTIANDDLTLGNVVTVSLVMGEDDVFSAGIKVKLYCEEEEKVKICRDGEFVEIKKSELQPGESENCDEVKICRDGKIVTVTEDKVLPTDSEKCDEVKVCRDGELITVSEDQVLDSDLEGNCPETLGTATELPNTGAGALTATALTLTTIASGAYGFIRNRS